MKVTIVPTSDGKWECSTYKDSMVVDTVKVKGSWYTETKRQGVPLRWYASHQDITYVGGKLTDKLGERIDIHRDSDLLNSSIVGENIIFTKDGVFTILTEGVNVGINNLGDKLREAGLVPDKTEVVIEKPPNRQGTDLTERVNESKKHIHESKETQTQSLKDFYLEKYGTPKNDLEAIKMLCLIYKDLIGNPSVEVTEGIAEYYRLITSRGLPAFYWLVEAFHVISKKAKEKQTMPYIIGMLRSWMKHGFGHIPSSEEEDVVNYVQEVVGTELSSDARNMIQTLLGTYGAVKCAIATSELKDCDVTYYMVLSLKDVLNKKFGEIHA